MDKLIIGTGHSANQYYATKLALSSHFITLVRGNRRYLAAGGFEYKQAAAVYPTTRFEDLGTNWKEIIRAFMAKHKVKNPLIPADTEAHIARHIAGAKLELNIFPERMIKTAQEVKHIKAVQAATEEAILAARDVLAASTMANRKAKYKGRWLTSEYLKSVIATKLAAHNCSCPEAIVSSGKQTALPHDRGSGTIREGPVILDIFPQSHETHYFSDCTRTFVVGKTPKTFDERYNAVLAVQKAAFKLIRHKAENVDRQTRSLFAEMGFATSTQQGTGYVHGLGHAVGLEVHEPPRMSAALTAGNIMTVEPGLYYDYGIRIEDIGLVTKTGFSNFTRLDKNPYL